MDLLIKSIKEHESFRDRIYLDSGGNLTGGYGHHFYVGSRIPVDVAEILFKQDLTLSMADFLKISPFLRKKLNTARARVVVEMIFNMSLQKVLGFVKFWKAVEMENWESARNELLDSKWHTQVGKRAETLAERFVKGEEE